MIDNLTALAFSLYENKGVYALLIGSGVSRAGQIPTGWEITLNLIERIAALQGITGEPDWARWYTKQFGIEPGYADLLDQLSSTTDERRSILHSFIEPTPEDVAEGRKMPTPAHRAIARLVRTGFIRVIITTNFDRLTEMALSDAGVQPTVVKSDDDLKGAIPITHSRCFLLKVHGDYLDTRLRNTDRELSSYSPETDALLDRILDEHGLIVCGWSGEWDTALRLAITRAPSRRYPLFWAAINAPSSNANDLITHRGGKVIAIETADAFFSNLERMVSVQVEMQRPNPRSTELLVSSTKKYLSKPEFRIQLNEIIGQEAQQLFVIVNNYKFPLGHLSKETFVPTITHYEAVVEPLARIFGVLGRWSSTQEFSNILNVIQTFGQPKMQDSSTILHALRLYPAMLLTYSYSLGVLKIDDYSQVFKLLTMQLLDQFGVKKSLVEGLLLTKWEAVAPELWNTLPEFNGTKRKLPLSEHLHRLFSHWTADYNYLPSDFTPLFDEFEMLGALAFLTQRYDKQELRQYAAAQPGFVSCPAGRWALNSKAKGDIFSRWEQEDIKTRLLGAGFARGDSEYLDAAKTNMQNLIGALALDW
jgi:hypothetical protein